MKSSAEKVKLRPHHLLCTFCFEGKGYSADFVRNYQKIATLLKRHPETEIEIVANTDDVCAPCPHRRGEACESQAKIEGLDARHSEMLQLKPGDTFSWTTGLAKIKTHVTLAQFHQACASCSWKTFGVCESKIKDYIQ